MKVVVTGTMESSRGNFNILKSRKNKVNLKRLIRLIKCKK
jgi:hypothetical protein